MFRMRYFVISLLFFVFAIAGTATAAELQSPTVNTSDNAIYNTGTIRGTSTVNTNVMVYLDGNFLDWADTENADDHESYSFQIPKESITYGEHLITLIAQERTSLLLSPPTNVELNSLLTENVTIPAPTILNGAETYLSTNDVLKLLGLTKDSTRIKLFLDGIPIYESSWLTHVSGTANFNYTLSGLEKGTYLLSAQAIDEKGSASSEAVINIHVEDPLPAPTLLGLEKGRFLRGLSTNNTVIQVFSSERLVKELNPNNDISGTANFIIDLGMGASNKEVRAMAIDHRGKKSMLSNLAVSVYASEMQFTPSISEEAVSEESPVAVQTDIKEEVPHVINDEATTPEDSASETVSAEDREIAGLFEDLKNEVKGQSGSVDETKKQQGRLQLNLLVFIIFLFGVIAWIFWVNRELIKERKELNELEKKSKEN